MAVAAAQLARIATRIGGFAAMRNVPLVPSGIPLKYENAAKIRAEQAFSDVM